MRIALYIAAVVAYLIGLTMGHIPRWATLGMMLYLLGVMIVYFWRENR